MNEINAIEMSEFLLPSETMPVFRHSCRAAGTLLSMQMSTQDSTPNVQENDPQLTATDIAKLYSNLENVINRVPTTESPSSPGKLSPYSTPLGVSSPRVVSPSASATSPLSEGKSSPPLPPLPAAGGKATDCPCQHIFASSAEHQLSSKCALCRRTLTPVDSISRDCDAQKRERSRLQRELEKEREKLTKCQKMVIELRAQKDDLEKRLEETSSQVQSLQKDLAVLNDKYVDEIERVSEIQHAKEMVENELEDLSRRLFEEANGMVAEEKRERSNLQVAYQHLENRLEETRERLAAEEMQLKELRQKMQQLESQGSERHSSVGSSSPAVGPIVDSSGLKEDPDRVAARDLVELFASNLRISMRTNETPVGIDSLQLDEFRDFVSMGRSLPLKKLHTASFMKHCQLEDVEPCLRFGPNSRLSARKLMEAIAMNSCYIEDAPPGFAEEQFRKRSAEDAPLQISALKFSVWDRFGSADNFIGCQACGRREPPLPYRFRISYFDDWACIDRFCRDRLVAVCEFYVFVRNVRQGYYSNRPIAELYREAMRLRLQMFYTR